MGKIVDTFKSMLLLSLGKSIDNIHPYRLKSAPGFYAGFERMTVEDTKREGFTISGEYKQEEVLFVMRIGPAVFRDWIPAWMFEPLFEPVPEHNSEDIIQTITEEMHAHFLQGRTLNEKAYALSVKLIKKCGGSIHHDNDDGQKLSTYIPIEDHDPVELTINEVKLDSEDRIVIKGSGYYTQEDYTWTCYDINQGMDILDFVLLYYKEQKA